MDKKEFLRYTKELFGECHGLLKVKGNDYADPANPFRNFEQIEAMGIASVEAGILTRMADKMSRLSNIVANSGDMDVKDETAQDTMMDLINYTVIFSAYWEEKHPSRKKARAVNKAKPKAKPKPYPKVELDKVMDKIEKVRTSSDEGKIPTLTEAGHPSAMDKDAISKHEVQYRTF